MTNKKENTIQIVAQGFYGNRVALEINRENINSFLYGVVPPEILPNADEIVDRRIIRVPDTDNIVIVYDQNKEDKYVNETFPRYYKRDAEAYKQRTSKELTMYISCEIPENDLTLHTRCFACRIDENGELQSLENGDGEKFIEYFKI